MGQAAQSNRFIRPILKQWEPEALSLLGPQPSLFCLPSDSSTLCDQHGKPPRAAGAEGELQRGLGEGSERRAGKRMERKTMTREAAVVLSTF